MILIRKTTGYNLFPQPLVAEGPALESGLANGTRKVRWASVGVPSLTCSLAARAYRSCRGQAPQRCRPVLESGLANGTRKLKWARVGVPSPTCSLAARACRSCQEQAATVHIPSWLLRKLVTAGLIHTDALVGQSRTCRAGARFKKEAAMEVW